ncbi:MULTISPECIES: LamB/YcsF family protein [Pontibacillus]|uniref:5-oxoprolinase subunit A n=1 Tax=Pontibacillus chungwhensis TaxID=265426 RepID=A0ABY8UW93_9BACI|nr:MULTISPECIES: 5-oxoprolinase subunit PxpA [Pontibacillus]MCD5323987.1 5-oxoprolinase subunit PxpA [Pontibacillus sp. HN14]WIF97950.1 5-oxoprolinase subunit PxpA [Pontibacillus chungwhensis]
MTHIDINADLGESYGAFQVGEDQQLMKVITSANVACGFHAGDYNVLAETIEQARLEGVAVGAHPGFQDLFGFGRREFKVSPSEVYNLMTYQLGAIAGVCRVKGVQLQHVKPHGALYNMASKDKDMAESIARAVYDFESKLILFGLSNSELVHAGEKMGLTVAREAFADRAYTSEGYLSPRSEKGSVLTSLEEIEKQVLSIIQDGTTSSLDGRTISLEADTICFHGDGDSAYKHAKHIKDLLKKKDIDVCKVGGS